MSVGVPDHAVKASYPDSAASDVAAERERLRGFVLDCAQCLLENDWRGAARRAYSAAWSFHRLPQNEQIAFIASPHHDDDGPIAVEDDWSASAFVAWLVYRINRSAPADDRAYRRSPYPEFDRFGRKYSAPETRERDKESSIARHATEALAARDLSQKGMF